MIESALSEFVFQSKYAKFIPEKGRKETFEEAIDRILQMHMKHLQDKYPQAIENSDFCNDFIQASESCKQGLIYGSQRALQFGGDPILKHNEKIYNCSFLYADKLDVFKKVEWLGLNGCGVGISVEKKHIDKLPSMCQNLNENTYNHTISDDIEGWSYAVDALIRYFFYSDFKYPLFDFSLVRPKGSPISNGFLAPGPEPLKNALRKMEDLLRKVHKRNDKRLKPIEVTDLLALEADSIISGGVRRSALSILFDPDDEEMYNSKIGNWWYENPQRGRYNASAVLERQSTSKEVFDKLFESTKQFGEPGFVWRSNDMEGFNPCFEIGFYAVDKYGNTGVQFCNLVSISGKNITNEDYFYKACKDAATIATIQASYMDFPFLGEVTENIVKNDPLIGVSISGIMMNPEVLLSEKVLRKGAEIIKEQNAKIASILGINPSSRCTCIKPDGNLGAMTGNTSGCHGEHARRYIRRVQVNKEEEAGQIYAKYNPRACVESIWSNNHTDNCLMFAIEANPNCILKKDLLGVKQLEVVRLLQTNWVRAGKRNPEDTIENNVSNTVQVDDWEAVKEYVWNNRNDLAGISFISNDFGELDYLQPAYSTVLTPSEIIEEYGEAAIFASGLIVDSIKVFGDLWKACDAIRGKGEKLFSTLEDAESFIRDFDIASKEDYLDKTVREWEEAQNKQYSKWVQLLVEMGYSEDFAENLLDNDIEISSVEIQKYLDKQMYNTVSNLSEKREIVRRLLKFADKYFDGEISPMVNMLKQVQLYHDWCDITKYYQPVDWSSIKWKKVPKVDVDTLAAASCNGGACEINKI